MKNDITYEYRVFTHRLIDVESMEVGICTSKIIEEIKPKDKVNGRFFHTSDTDEWFFCWNNELQKLNLKGDSDINAALAEVEKLIADANAAVSDAKKTATEAKNAAAEAKTAADAASAAVESIENKADKSEVEAVSKAVEEKADKSVVDTLSAKVDAIKIPSLDEYATKEFVSDEIKKIDIPTVPTNVSKFTNDAGYLNKSEADKLYAPIGSASDGSGSYATQDFVKDEIAKIDIPTVPTKVSAFTNDAGYLTEHQDISGKQDAIDDLEDIRANAELAKTALQTIPEEYVTEDELAAKGYATIDQLNGKQDDIDDLTAIRSGAALGATALQAIPEEYVTEDELAAKGYLTEHQSLDNYYTKKEIDDKIDAINTLIGQAIDITNTILA